MNLLLLLSALLSAIAGVSGTRASAEPVTACASTAPQTQIDAVAPAASRPVVRLATPDVLARRPLGGFAVPLLPRPFLWKDRRRE